MSIATAPATHADELDLVIDWKATGTEAYQIKRQQIRRILTAAKRSGDNYAEQLAFHQHMHINNGGDRDCSTCDGTKRIPVGIYGITEDDIARHFGEPLLTDGPVIERPFWESIRHALHLISTRKPASFEGVKAILDLHGDPQGSGSHTLHASFFAGSGGDDQLLEALLTAGWRVIWNSASYHYLAESPVGDRLTYTEGDVERGDRTGR